MFGDSGKVTVSINECYSRRDRRPKQNICFEILLCGSTLACFA